MVCAASDPSSSTDVALKIFLLEDQQASAGSKQNFRKIFLKEVETTKLLDHPNIVKVLDAGTDGDLCYIATELVEGGWTLKRYCTPDTLLPCEMVIDIISRCAKVLDYIHHKGVIHQDIKPANILVTSDMDMKLTDFGLAHITNEYRGDEVPVEDFAGSPRYMSPEQIRGESPITQQTDIFSLGVILYEMLSGKHPFEADNFSSLMYKIINHFPPLLGSVRAGIPKVLDQICYHALAKEKEKRYHFGLDLASDLSLAFEFLDTSKKVLEKKDKLNPNKSLKFSDLQ